jgi:hypothetical protein
MDHYKWAERVRTFNDFWAFILVMTLALQWVAIWSHHRWLLIIGWVPSSIQIAATIIFRGCPLRILERKLRQAGARKAKSW